MSPPEDDATATSVRLPAVQPDAATGSRYQLFADEPTAAAPPQAPAEATWTPDTTVTNQRAVDAPIPSAGPASAWTTGTTRDVSDFGEQPPAQPTGQRRAARAPRGPWIALLVVLLLMSAAGGWLLIKDDDSDDAGAKDATSQSSQTPTTDSSPSPSQSPTVVPPPEPPAGSTNVAASAQVNAPAPATPGQDLSGNPVEYPVGNMLDDDPSTAYRITGDATGTEILFTLADEAEVNSVGLINGYAKSESGADWYASNRKIRRVSWHFDDGTVIKQRLRATTDLQVVPVPGVTTRTVRLRLDKVSKPGANPRNTTAISSVLIEGASPTAP
ncbi:NADase-type glycan-binding domain-containing protein [Nocardioides sp. Bht2]|uniref:NADase-type glycan-binding domain-containing protein n=1 Tax=Nocardioides sp. Bht2 TaxID=3392297 RepID=UPI0039B4CDD9